MFRDNPFQIVGLTASAKEQARQASRIQAFFSLGKPLQFEDEVVFHGCRRNSNTAHHTLRKIEDARARLVLGIFWFTDRALVDDKLLELIANEDWKVALD